MAAVQFVVLQLILLLLIFWSFDDPSVIADAQVPIAKYGCRDSCGNVAIPYPFGMEKKGCYIEKRFKINCNSTSGVPTISISGIDMEVTNISIHYNTITVNFPVVYANCEGKESKSSAVLDLEGNPFAFSSAENYFIAKGCHNVALITPKNEDSHPWCVSFCEKESDNGLYMSACTKNTWYLTNIPSGLKVFNVTFKGFDNKAKLGSSSSNSSGKLGECRCASLIEQTQVDNSVSDLRDVDFVPVVLDWGIDNEIFQSFVESQGCHISTSIHICGASGPPINSSSRPNSTIQCYSTVIPDDHNPYLDNFCEGKRNGNRTKMATIGIGAGLGTMFLLIGLWRLYKVFKRRRNEKKKKKFFKRNGGLLLQEQLSSGEVNVEKIKMFPSKELKRATDRYNVNRMLGQGGQGTVYKGMLADGKIVAVKKSKILDEENVKQFINEVVILSQINHRNVVKLLGCCLETEVPLLVYEFIPNGTLFQFLHDPNEELQLTWEMRLRIATDVAGALFYLHSAASSPIYHRDIKSTNILLDEKYRAKVADFGTSRSVTIEQTHVTTRVQGTFGYLDPEYFQSSQFTDKSDVYSFGVVLVELLTGKKPVSFTRSEEQATSFVTSFLMAMASNYLFDVLDPQVVKQGKREDVFMVASLAWSCLKLNGKERPTMKEVTMALEGIHKSHDFMVPQEIEIDQNEVTIASSELASTSINSSSNIYSIPSQDSKPFLFTY